MNILRQRRPIQSLAHLEAYIGDRRLGLPGFVYSNVDYDDGGTYDEGSSRGRFFPVEDAASGTREIEFRVAKESWSEAYSFIVTEAEVAAGGVCAYTRQKIDPEAVNALTPETSK